MENSIQQENTTETLDIEARVPLTQKRGNSTSKTTLYTATTVKSCVKKPSTRSNHSNRSHRSTAVAAATSSGASTSRKLEFAQSTDGLTNSTSLTMTTPLFNDNGISQSSGIAPDIDSGAYTEFKKFQSDQDGSVYSGVSSDRFSHRSHGDKLSDVGHQSLRRESTSTYERDMDIIDLLERERSVNLQEFMEAERRTDARSRIKTTTTRTNSGRKLPDITKIAGPHSPKRHPSTHTEPTNNFPNFVYTYKFNEFAEANSNRNRDSDTSCSQYTTQTSFGRSESEPQENEIRARTRSIDSRKSSIKSAQDQRQMTTANYTADM